MDISNDTKIEDKLEINSETESENRLIDWL